MLGLESPNILWVNPAPKGSSAVVGCISPIMTAILWWPPLPVLKIPTMATGLTKFMRRVFFVAHNDVVCRKVTQGTFHNPLFFTSNLHRSREKQTYTAVLKACDLEGICHSFSTIGLDLKPWVSCRVCHPCYRGCEMRISMAAGMGVESGFACVSSLAGPRQAIFPQPSLPC